MSRSDDAGRDHDSQPARYDATPYLPKRGGLPAHRQAAAECRGCPLFEKATRTVFGEGTSTSRIVLVGEQPGDQEDRRGQPFVGSAGRLLDKALAEAGIERDTAYVTNAVKHFKFTLAENGKRRIHKPPDLRELAACRPWLRAELRLIRPDVVVVLGATAGKALLGPSFRVTRDRGTLIPLPDEDGNDGEAARCVVATLHPSAVLRSDDREAAYAGLVADLEVAARALRKGQ
ncbi:UdgX family uracil-DNA binding protein [Streptomyces sp. NPDC092369]|uniref:UdgX family uracil-DNA binding protein n=1 Tax=Streptomyces sp. NPDC092369 TaxID=3366015 RepID=UPI003825F546